MRQTVKDPDSYRGVRRNPDHLDYLGLKNIMNDILGLLKQ
jgi:hypothetical protein